MSDTTTDTPTEATEAAEAARPDLDAIEARANAADASPWFSEGKGVYGADHKVVLVGVCNCPIRASDRANADFIAAARQDVPVLVAYCRRIESENAELRELLTPAYKPNMPATMPELPGEAQDGQGRADFPSDGEKGASEGKGKASGSEDAGT